MTKLDKLSQAEQMYIYENQPLDLIGKKLALSRRTLFYWKKEYEWDKKRFENGREQELFNRELINFAQKIMDKISNDIDNNQQTPQAEMYSLMNILKNLPQMKTQIPEPKQKLKSKKKEYLPEDIVKTTKLDKKMEAGAIKFVLLCSPGEAYVARDVSDEELLLAARYICGT